LLRFVSEELLDVVESLSSGCSDGWEQSIVGPSSKGIFADLKRFLGFFGGDELSIHWFIVTVLSLNSFQLRLRIPKQRLGI
jgi:hypothetical protein